MPDTPLKNRYRLYLCPSCGEQFQFAGFCEFCNQRLGAFSCIPIEKILEMRDRFEKESSPIPAEFIRSFVEELLSPPESSPSHGS